MAAARRNRPEKRDRVTWDNGISHLGLAFCWAHLWSRFYQLAVADVAPIGDEALQRVAALNLIEKDIRGRSADGGRAVPPGAIAPASRRTRPSP
jgi:hypothetical protein